MLNTAASTATAAVTGMLLVVWSSFGAGLARAEGTNPRPDPPVTSQDVVHVVVRAQPRRIEGISTVITADDGRRLPGTQGDAVKAITTLPGVARTSLGSGEPILWGAAPQDSRILIDGIEVPYLFHGGALRSVVATELLQSVTLVAGAPPVDVGRLLGGVVRVKTRPLTAERLGGHLSVDLLDSGVSVHTPLGERVQILVAGRFGWIDQTAPWMVATVRPLEPSPDRGGRRIDAFDQVALPRYHDAQAKISVALGAHEELSLLWLHAQDLHRRVIPSSDPTAWRQESRQQGFHRLALHWRRSGTAADVAEVSLWIGCDDDRLESNFGPRRAQLARPSWVYGLRASHRLPIAPQLNLQLGLDALGTETAVTHVGTLTRPAREGDVAVFGEAPGVDIAREVQDVRQLGIAPYVDLQLSWGTLRLVPGLRAEGVLVETEQVRPTPIGRPPIGDGRILVSIDPRLTATWQLAKPLLLRAAVARTHQPARPEELGPVFGNPGLELAAATHLAAGPTITLPLGVTTELTGYYRHFEALTSRSADAAPALGQVLMPTGEGEAWGAQIQVRRRSRQGLVGMVSWTISRSERRDRPGAALRLFDYDQPHVFSAVVSQTLGSWTLGVRTRLASGFPRTRVIGSVYDARADGWQPVHGTQNADRLPTFFQADVRVDRRFQWSGLEAEASVELQNVTFTRNVEEFVWSQDWSKRGGIFGLPPLVLLGLRVSR